MENSTYKMFPEKNFAIVKFKPGIFTIEDGQLINKLYKLDPDYSKIHYLLVILTGCKPNFTVNELHYISEFYNNEFQVNNHITSIWLVDEPLLTAFAHQFVSLINEQSQYCSTLEKAYSLIKVSYTFDEFKHIVNSIT